MINKLDKLRRGIHYFYRIDNIINGKFYYGIRTCHCLPGQDSYMGSGTYLSRSKDKYGIENFKKTILKILPTRQDVSDLERWIVTEELIKNPMCYNQVVGGDDQDSFFGKIACIDTLTERNVSISKSEYYDNLDRYKNFNALKGRVVVYDMTSQSNEKPICVISVEDYYNNKDRYKFILSSNKGEGNYKNLLTGEIIRMPCDDPRIASGEFVGIWTGKRHSKETRDKMSMSRKGKGGTKGQKWVTNGYTTIRIKEDQFQSYLDKGYRTGRK